MKAPGVYITYGPVDYQIIQQENGFATIYLEGTVVIDEKITKAKP